MVRFLTQLLWLAAAVPGPFDAKKCVLVGEEDEGGEKMQIGNDAVQSDGDPNLGQLQKKLSLSFVLNPCHASVGVLFVVERRIEIAAVNDPPRVHLPGQVFRRNLSVVWPDTEELEVAFTNPIVVDEDALLDVPSVTIAGKSRLVGCADLAGMRYNDCDQQGSLYAFPATTLHQIYSHEGVKQ